MEKVWFSFMTQPRLLGPRLFGEKCNKWKCAKFERDNHTLFQGAQKERKKKIFSFKVIGKVLNSSQCGCGSQSQTPKLPCLVWIFRLHPFRSGQRTVTVRECHMFKWSACLFYKKNVVCIQSVYFPFLREVSDGTWYFLVSYSFSNISWTLGMIWNSLGHYSQLPLPYKNDNGSWTPKLDSLPRWKISPNLSPCLCKYIAGPFPVSH
jgi:hypothetical protein